MLRYLRQSSRHSLRLALWMRLLGMSLCAGVLLIGPIDLYWQVLDAFYPDGDAPRMHPLTWLCLSIAFFATARQHILYPARQSEIALWVMILLISTTRTTLAPLVEALLPLADVGQMGANTAAGCAFLAVGQIFRSRLRPGPGLAVAALSCLLPLVAINGLLLGQDSFYDEMSAPTALALLGLGIANLMRYLRVPALYMLMDDTPTAELVRRQIRLWGGMSILMPFALRLVADQLGVGFAMLYTLQMSCILIGIVHFGLRFAEISARSETLQRITQRDLETDQLTGAATRRAAFSRFKTLSAHEDVGLIVLDIDHFKAINDTHGHNVGDKVLQAVAAIVRENLRMSDLLVRWGGEEFVVIIPMTDDVRLADRAEALREEVQMQTEWRTDLPKVTASFGTVLIPAGSDVGLLDGVASADIALYAAKAGGRNQVVSGKELTRQGVA